MGALPAWMHVHHICAWYMWNPEESIESPGTGAVDGVNHHTGAVNCTRYSSKAANALNY